MVVIDRANKKITPAKLAPAGYLDQFSANVLSSTLFTLVGYGTEVRKPEDGPQTPTPIQLSADPSQHRCPWPEARRSSRSTATATTHEAMAEAASVTQAALHPRRVRRHGHELRVHQQLPLSGRPAACRHRCRTGMVGHVRRATRCRLTTTRRVDAARCDGRVEVGNVPRPVHTDLGL